MICSGSAYSCSVNSASGVPKYLEEYPRKARADLPTFSMVAVLFGVAYSVVLAVLMGDEHQALNDCNSASNVGEIRCLGSP